MKPYTDKAHIAVIGGSGLYSLEGMQMKESIQVDTPYGKPSGGIRIGQLEGKTIAFLARHGEGHRFNPTHVPYRANIYALKSLGVRRILAVSAVGSLRLEIKPCDFVVPDQVIDRTRQRPLTFFDDLAVHLPFADPFCPQLSRLYVESATKAGVTIHEGGTYVCIEGPAFSTKAESRLYRSWEADIIGMTCLPEARLAREAEMCYATLAASTDYDVWHEEPVTTEIVLANFARNLDNIRKIVREAISKVSDETECCCQQALRGTLITASSAVTDSDRERYGLLLGRYLKA